MKKKLICILSILILATLLIACGKKENTEPETVSNDAALFGTWTEDYFDSGYTFNEDGTGIEIFYNQAFTYTAADGNLKIHYEQTDIPYEDKVFVYSINDTTLTLDRAEIKDANGNIISEAQTFTYNKAQ